MAQWDVVQESTKLQRQDSVEHFEVYGKDGVSDMDGVDISPADVSGRIKWVQSCVGDEVTYL